MIARGNQPHHGSLQVAATHKVIAIRMAIATVVRTRIRKAERKTIVIISKSVTGEVTTETSTSANRKLYLCFNSLLCSCSWPKRDSHGSPDKTTKMPARRKHPRSSSRSRSRSPAESYYSRRSSRGRSRSRSVTPASKRRRRDSSPAAPRSRTPSDRGRKVWNPQPDRAYSKSPSSHRRRDSRGARRRSLSSASSMSTSRSSSRSPTGRPRAVHRLPPATTVVTISPTALARGSRIAPRDSGSHRNGKNQSNGKRSTVCETS
jgi:hypothetical protein